MGGTNIGISLPWHDIEPHQGQYVWDIADKQIEMAQLKNLEMFAYTGLTPDWALDPEILKKYGPGIGYRFPPMEKYMELFKNFHKMLSERYKGKIKYYEFWNE